MKKYIIGLITLSSAISGYAIDAPQSQSDKPRIIISTDIGGTDPDDNQSMTHLLMYNNLFDIEGIVSSPSFGNGSKEEIIRMIELYAKDYPKLASRQEGFLSPDSLIAICKQGNKTAAPFAGYSLLTEGSRHISECALRESDRPLWILVWGTLDDLAQALHDTPEIASRIRVYYIGGPNKKWGADSYAYIAKNFPNLFFIENNASYRGFPSSPNAEGIFQKDYYETFMRGAGALGADFKKYYDGVVKMGDSPSLFYLMKGDHDNPEADSWGGRFERISHSPRHQFKISDGAKNTATTYSIVEFTFNGPSVKIPTDSACVTLHIDKQDWPGYYAGKGKYIIRYSPKAPGNLEYTITSPLNGFKTIKGELRVEGTFPGERSKNDYRLGKNWYTDVSDPAMASGKWQGAKTIGAHREEILSDWVERLNWIKDDSMANAGKKSIRVADSEFFKTEEARRIGNQIIAYQRATGGWPKNINMSIPFSATEAQSILADKGRTDDSTTDNTATTTQIYYLARLYNATGDDVYRKGAEDGIRFLLAGQYDNGGWPQFWPNPHGYQIHITFNDDAMTNTMALLNRVSHSMEPFDTDIISDELRQSSKTAFDKGVECILKCQIKVDGKPTVWCQQHDRDTYAPAPARAFELASYCSSESSAIVWLLMDIPDPSQEIIDAIDGAMRWFEKYKIEGIRIGSDGEIDGKKNHIVVNDEAAEPIWARFYDLVECEPMFCDRDGIPRKSMAEIGPERRNGYSWYSYGPSYLYPRYNEWKSKLTTKAK